MVSWLFFKNLVDVVGYMVYFGYFLDYDGQLLDEVLVIVFWLGKSFIGEEMVEIVCYGLLYIQ